jgi:hypothetical protein
LASVHFPARLPSAKSTQNIVKHAVNEREYRGLQQCHAYVGRLYRYLQRIKASHPIAYDERFAPKAESLSQSLELLNGLFDNVEAKDSKRPAVQEVVSAVTAKPSCTSVSDPGDMVPPSCLEQNPDRSVRVNNTQQPEASNHSSSSASNCSELSMNLFPSSPPAMLPQPIPEQAHRHPYQPMPGEGSLSNPYKANPFSLGLKTTYRGASQPYHNVVLVIDSTHWATTAGLIVLRFGRETDWDKPEAAIRQQAALSIERVSLARDTHRRWLGDVLVECFIGVLPTGSHHREKETDENPEEGNEAISEEWPSTDKDLGLELGRAGPDLGFADEFEIMDEETAAMLRNPSAFSHGGSSSSGSGSRGIDSGAGDGGARVDFLDSESMR